VTGATASHKAIRNDILGQKDLLSGGRGCTVAYQITLSELEYKALAAAAARSGTDPEQLLHDMIQRLESLSQSKHTLTAREVAERQYHEGKISLFRHVNP
jgi:hypothetical protein